MTRASSSSSRESSSCAKGDAVVRVLRSGTVHGELFLQESESHQYTAIAREDAHVLNLGRHDVFDALLEYPEFGVAMVQDLALRHHKLTERVIELEQQLPSPAPEFDETAEREGIEHSAPAPKAPQTPRLVAAGRASARQTAVCGELARVRAWEACRHLHAIPPPRHQNRSRNRRSQARFRRCRRRRWSRRDRH